MNDVKDYIYLKDEISEGRLNAYDLQLKLLQTAIKDFVAEKPKMGQAEKWEAFDLMAESFSDVIERKKLIDMVNGVIRAKGN